MSLRVLKSKIKEVFENAGIPDGGVVIERARTAEFGDLASNAPLAVAKRLEKIPIEFAEKLKSEISDAKIKGVERIKVASPGFINFILSKSFVDEELSRILKSGPDVSYIFPNKKILVEHSSPNLFKPFHIGHLMNNSIGESVTRLLKESGADVSVISYPSDMSLGIAKAIYVLMQKGDIFSSNKSNKEMVDVFGEAYVEGTNLFEENEDVKLEVRKIATSIYENEESRAKEVYDKAREINLNYFKEVVGELGSVFDEFVFESEAGVIGKKLVEDHMGDIFVKSEGAVVYVPKEDSGLHTRVFINSDGNPTYEAKDVGLLSIKFNRFNPDTSIFVTDNEQGPYFKVVVEAASEINSSWKDKTIHLTHGRLRFEGKRLSSRLGGTPKVADLIEDLSKEVFDKFGKEREVSEDTAKSVAISALKFAILKSKPGQNINFDPEKSLSFEGDSGPYLQYTVARINSILEKGHEAGLIDEEAGFPSEQLARSIIHFEDAIEEAIANFAPHTLLLFALSIAQEFNTMYAKEIFIKENDKKHSAEYLNLVAVVKKVLAKSLYLLGIPVLERM